MMKKQKQKLWIVALLLVMAVVPMAAYAQSEEDKLSMEQLRNYMEKVRKKEVNPLDAYIINGEDKRVTIREMAKGRPVLLHFWATWCAPCIQEMPTLDKLVGEYDKEKLLILALSEDFGGIEKVKKFLERKKLAHIEPYVDVMTGASNNLGVVALPTTVFLDKEGKVLEFLEGPVKWDDPMIAKIIDVVIKDKSTDTEGKKEATPDKPQKDDPAASEKKKGDKEYDDPEPEQEAL